MQHIFIDVEAFGPPGIGRPFAIGAAKFNADRGVFARRQWNIGPTSVCAGRPAGGDHSTIEWLTQQESRVLAQLKNGRPFQYVWPEVLEFVDQPFSRCGSAVWADDWSDFAWLDIEARLHGLKTLRDYGAQFDSSAIVALADPLKVYSEEKYGVLVPHIAEHDAVTGALDLLASLHILGRQLPGDAPA